LCPKCLSTTFFPLPSHSFLGTTPSSPLLSFGLSSGPLSFTKNQVPPSGHCHSYFPLFPPSAGSFFSCTTPVLRRIASAQLPSRPLAELSVLTGVPPVVQACLIDYSPSFTFSPPPQFPFTGPPPFTRNTGTSFRLLHMKSDCSFSLYLLLKESELIPSHRGVPLFTRLFSRKNLNSPVFSLLPSLVRRSYPLYQFCFLSVDVFPPLGTPLQRPNSTS